MRSLYYISICFFFCSSLIFGQTPVSGYVTLEDQDVWKNKVYLSKIEQNENNSAYSSITIASATIDKDGFFAFDQKLFDQEDQMYKVQLQPISLKEKKKLSDKIKTYRLFIASKKDTIFFNKSIIPFGSYTTNNKADLEWQRLKKFKTRFENLTTDFDPEQYLIETKGYVKDSLQILLVKLIGIKTLDDENLLDKDIKENPDYYFDLIQELKSSELDPATYLYLENKLTYLIQEQTNKKYHTSLWINGIAILIILALVSFIIISRKKRSSNQVPLSKQEKIVKDLIVSGKSNKEIANELFVSISTVKTHITNIYGKLNISNRQELLSKK